ncbi:hypothetical protein Tco_0791443 [Tanacetum coccineum]
MVFHNEDGNPARANIKQALGYPKDGYGDGNSQFLRCQISTAMEEPIRFPLNLINNLIERHISIRPSWARGKLPSQAGKSADSLLTFEDQYIVLGEDEAEKHQLEEKVLKSTDFNTHSPLLRERARTADSHNIKDQLSVVFEREVVEDTQNMQSYYRLSNKLREAVRMRDEYINELQTTNNSNDVADSIEIMRCMQHDDIEKASRLMVMAREMQTTVHEKKVTMRLRLD